MRELDKRQETREMLLNCGLCFRKIHLGMEPLLEFGGQRAGAET